MDSTLALNPRQFVPGHSNKAIVRRPVGQVDHQAVPLVSGRHAAEPAPDGRPPGYPNPVLWFGNEFRVAHPERRHQDFGICRGRAFIQYAADHQHRGFIPSTQHRHGAGNAAGGLFQDAPGGGLEQLKAVALVNVGGPLDTLLNRTAGRAAFADEWGRSWRGRPRQTGGRLGRRFLLCRPRKFDARDPFFLD